MIPLDGLAIVNLYLVIFLLENFSVSVSTTFPLIPPIGKTLSMPLFLPYVIISSVRSLVAGYVLKVSNGSG